MASDRKNLIYADDAGVEWLAQNVAAYLTNLGFRAYDPATDAGTPNLPPGFRMRRANMVYVDPTGRVRRRDFPVGMVNHDVYKGAATVTVTAPGINISGTPANAIKLTYRLSSTRGELRRFLTVTDSGYTDLVGQEYIGSVTPTP